MNQLHFPRFVRALSSALTLIAGIVLLCLCTLTVADVVSRNVWGQSILGAMEISALLLVSVAYFGLAAAELDGRHVSVSLVEERLSIRARAALSFLRAALLAVLGVLLIVGIFGVFGSAIERGETTNDILRLPTWPAKLVVLLSFALFFLVAVWKQILMFLTLRAGEDIAESNIDPLVDQARPVSLGGSRDR